MKFLILVCSITLFITNNLSAQTKISLTEANEILKSNNTNIKQAALQEKISRIELDQAYDNLMPNLGFSMNNQNTMGLNFDQITGQLITGNQWTHFVNANVNSSITIFQGFRGYNNIQLSKVNLDLSKMDTERLKYELQIQLINLYFQSLINYDLYQAATSQSKLSEQLVLAEDSKLETGKSTILDLAQAQSKLANDQLNLTNAKNAYDLSMFKLKQLLELDDEIELIKPVVIQQEPLLNEYTIAVNDPYLKIVNRKIDQSIINNRLAKSGYYPTISFNTGYGTNYSSQRFTSSYSSKVMPLIDQMNSNRSLYLNFTLSYNIFDKNNTKASIIKSNINTESLKLEREKVIRERAQTYNQLKLEWSAAVEENKAIESAYTSSKMNYEAMKERFEVGKNSSIDLFKALTDFNMNEFRKITSSYNILLKEELIKLQISE
ncbi:TolC family protein [Sphingobacterium bovisgrunnientis]|uniref:TolC family protein n=1 Tax=Sphingobacterium bovisgrunnientis TaxID=1874697 RepID=UPI0013587664|nr:TolC family protein [Sphingobacterium bovisgrunnientis]